MKPKAYMFQNQDKTRKEKQSWAEKKKFLRGKAANIKITPDRSMRTRTLTPKQNQVRKGMRTRTLTPTHNQVRKGMGRS